MLVPRGVSGKMKRPENLPQQIEFIIVLNAFPLNNFLDPCMHCLIASCEETYSFNNGCCASGIYPENFPHAHIFIYCTDGLVKICGCALFIINVNIGPTASFHKTEITLVQNSSKIPIYSKST